MKNPNESNQLRFKIESVIGAKRGYFLKLPFKSCSIYVRAFAEPGFKLY